MFLPRRTFFAVMVLTITAMIATKGVVQGNFQVKCDLGSARQDNLSYTAVGNLTSHFGDARSCRIVHDASSGILRVRLSKQNQNISVIYAVVIEKKEITFVGTARYVDLMLGQGYHFHSCPEKTNQTQIKNIELGLFIFGAPENATFKLEINLDNTFLSPGETNSIKVQKNGLAQVLAFDVLEEDLFKLLQITVTSDDDTISYLVVSKSCSDVQKLGVGITTQSLLTKELKLSFSKSGRLTLSQYSSPKIETGRWYIGVLVEEGSVNNIEEKAVNVSITQTYSYDTLGKGLPVLYMCLSTGILGLVVAVFAHFLLNSDFEEMSPPFYVEGEALEKEASFQSRRIPDKTILNFIPPPIPRRSFPFKCWLKVVVVHWFGRGTKTYSYLTVVLAVSFLVGSAQFVIGRWANMVATGDRDKCYYNELCYRPIAVADLPSNFLVSNVPYCLHGVILALSFSFREAVSLNYRDTQASFSPQGSQFVPVPYDFSLAYALSWALVFEGLFSATYHLCPSRLTFQFDSAFMFIISGLVVVALFNARIDKMKSSEGRHPSETIVQAPKYFLFFVAPLLVLNYIGSIRDTDGLPRFVEVFYWLVLLIWLVVVYVWAFRKVGISCGSGPGLMNRFGCATCEDRVKWFWMILVPICLLIIGFTKWSDWSQFFLFSCVAAVVLTIGGLISYNVITSLKSLKHQAAYHALNKPNRPLCDIKAMCLAFVRNLHRVFFIVVLFLFWVFAMYFFKLKPTAKKTASPSESRTFNDECVLWDFFDYHDIWHMLSSVALLMSAFLLIYITRSVEKYFWVDANYWYNKMKKQNKITVNLASAKSLDTEGYTNDADIELDDRSPKNEVQPAADEGKINLRKDIQTSKDRDNVSYRTSRPHSRVESLV